MGNSIRIVNYAVNGGGVGHLQRLVAVSRWLRRYAAHAGLRAEIYFLTSSEADGLLFHERFASFKLPSKTVVGDAGIDKQTYLALAKQWVWHSVGLLRPDLLVVDTFPRGSFGELLGALDLCRHRAFIYRPVKDAFAARADFQAMLPLYDSILVPEHEAVDVPVPSAIRHRVVHTGPVISRERSELCTRDDARRRLEVPDDAIAIYVSAGGGGDPTAEAQLHDVIDALADDPSLYLVVGAGPLYRGRVRHGARIAWVTSGIAELLPGIDLAICAVGYNTYYELMQVGVPAVFLPQTKIADEQDRRAARAVEVGAAELLSTPVDATALRAAVDRWRDPAVRARGAEAARGLVPENGARHLAGELLRLVLPAATVDAAEAAVGDDVLASASRLGLELAPYFELARLLERVSISDEGDREPERALERATGLVEAIVGHGVPIGLGLRVVGDFIRKAAVGRVDDRADAAAVLLDELAAFGDWGAAATLIKVFGVERRVPAAQFAGDVVAFLSRLRSRGDDLYRGIAYLSGAQATGDHANVELLRLAQERCR